MFQKAKLFKATAGVILALVLVLVGCATADSMAPRVALSTAISLSQTGNIAQADINTSSGLMTIRIKTGDASINVTDINGDTIRLTSGTVLATNIDGMNAAQLQELGFTLPEDFSTNALGGSGLANVLWIVLPLLLTLGLFMLLFRSGRPENRALGFARSRAKLVSPYRSTISFADVAGVEEAKEDLQEVVEFLKNRRKFQAIGATIPKGVLLLGPPGTGKTLLARAVAGEAGVPFFSVSGSEFVEIFVGVGAARVRDMFEQAKNHAPCIVFIDEIDAVGRSRSAIGPGSHEEREQTLNQILVEMDGFDPNLGVIVLAATNRPDVLDPALLRPGRFDRRVTLDRPDIGGRKAILEIHAKGKTLEKGVDLETVARETHGFSGADLANLMNEAAILAVRRNKTVIGMEEVEESIDRVIAGPERKSLKIHPREKEITAYHEAGHAVVARMLPNVDPVHKISIVARGTMGGYTRLLSEDRYFMTASKFMDTLATLLAGHGAEEMVFGEVSTGPHSDLKQATDLARKMVTDYGMSKKLGLRTYGDEPLYPGAPPQRDYSDTVARQIDDEVNSILDEAYSVSKRLLSENRARLNHLVSKLLVNETLQGPELENAFTEPLATPAKA